MPLKFTIIWRIIISLMMISFSLQVKFQHAVKKIQFLVLFHSTMETMKIPILTLKLITIIRKCMTMKLQMYFPTNIHLMLWIRKGLWSVKMSLYLFLSLDMVEIITLKWGKDKLSLMNNLLIFLQIYKQKI